MNPKQKSNTLLVMALIAGLAAMGCNQTSSTSKLTQVADKNVQEKTENGCCGNCGVDQKLASKTDGCCGKCGGDQKLASKMEGCCGKCGGDKVAAQAGCNGNCDACAKGDSSKCKCEDESPISKTDPQEKHVNTHAEDRDIFHFLLKNHEKLTRKVTDLDNGVETLTESSDPALARKIQQHVASMYGRVEDGRRIRMWDSLYREVFAHADKIEMKLENTKNGIKVIETSDDAYVVKLIQAHAKVVSGFVEKGFAEAQQNHEPPKR